jgi:dihydrofolate synthase/folylpolyglutamate synthase
MITRLLMAHGLTVGTYTSPHLERVNERMTYNSEPIGDDDFAEQVGAVADLEVLAGVRPTYFEAVTAASFRWFSDLAVDVAVIEVGLFLKYARAGAPEIPADPGDEAEDRPLAFAY